MKRTLPCFIGINKGALCCICFCLLSQSVYAQKKKKEKPQPVTPVAAPRRDIPGSPFDPPPNPPPGFKVPDLPPLSDGPINPPVAPPPPIVVEPEHPGKPPIPTNPSVVDPFPRLIPVDPPPPPRQPGDEPVRIADLPVQDPVGGGQVPPMVDGYYRLHDGDPAPTPFGKEIYLLYHSQQQGFSTYSGSYAKPGELDEYTTFTMSITPMGPITCIPTSIKIDHTTKDLPESWDGLVTPIPGPPGKWAEASIQCHYVMTFSTPNPYYASRDYVKAREKMLGDARVEVKSERVQCGGNKEKSCKAGHTEPSDHYRITETVDMSRSFYIYYLNLVIEGPIRVRKGETVTYTARPFPGIPGEIEWFNKKKDQGKHEYSLKVTVKEDMDISATYSVDNATYKSSLKVKVVN